MEIYDGITGFAPPPTGTTLAIGNFDGVHRGHQRILETARVVARRLGTSVVVMTFEPHPLAVLAPDRAPARLTTLPEKLHLLRAAGIDACLVVPSVVEFLGQTAEEFLAGVTTRCRPRAIVEGADFNFGRGRGGSLQTLREYGQRHGFLVEVVETARCGAADGPIIRSTAIRAALRDGAVELAAAMLGRPYRIVGVVSRGDGRGARLGFPTANLAAIGHLLPREAVYAAVAELADSQMYLAAVNIGPQPTFGQRVSRVEAHLLDWPGAPVENRVALHFLARLREQRCFTNGAELAAQLASDVTAARALAGQLAALRQQPRIPL